MDRKTGLYSKAAQIIRNLPQEKGSVEQMIGAARKLGLRENELQNAGSLPSGPITREELAQIFEARLPSVAVTQYGQNPSYLSRDEQQERIALQNRKNGRGEPLSPEEEARHQQLSDRLLARPNEEEDEDEEAPASPQYGDYRSDNGKNYRERLLKLNTAKKYPVRQAEERVTQAKDTLWHHESGLGSDHPITQQSRSNLERLQGELEKTKRLYGDERQQGTYQSSHWSDHPNVLAHIRLSDREIKPDRADMDKLRAKMADHYGIEIPHQGAGLVEQAVKDGVLTPQEAASVSNEYGFRNDFYGRKGIGKRLLHVEELQSDWAQEGRDQGFRSKPYRVWNKKTGQTVSEHDTHDAAWDAYRMHPDNDKLDYGHNNAPPPAPYVTNTQHWTDLALKNVLREAALGNYDGIVFPTGQNQADRYGLDKHIMSLSLKRPQDGNSFGRLTAQGYSGRPVFDDEIKDANHLNSLVGRDVAERLLSSQGVVNQNEQTVNHYISGTDLKMGGQGMRSYYDGIVPKSVMKLAQMHDPEIKPAEPVSYSENEEDYQGFHLPMTDKLRQGILEKGFPAMKRGGSVDAALAATRRFTKDGAGAMMRLKS